MRLESLTPVYCFRVIESESKRDEFKRTAHNCTICWCYSYNYLAGITGYKLVLREHDLRLRRLLRLLISLGFYPLSSSDKFANLHLLCVVFHKQLVESFI